MITWVVECNPAPPEPAPDWYTKMVEFESKHPRCTCGAFCQRITEYNWRTWECKACGGRAT